jgi:hypothetical protein
METREHNLALRMEDVNADRQHDLEVLGIAKNAREEKLRARDAKIKKTAQDAEMEKLYRKHILKEPDAPQAFVPLSTIAPANGNGKKAVKEEPVLGD